MKLKKYLPDWIQAVRWVLLFLVWAVVDQKFQITQRVLGLVANVGGTTTQT